MTLLGWGPNPIQGEPNFLCQEVIMTTYVFAVLLRLQGEHVSKSTVRVTKYGTPN